MLEIDVFPPHFLSVSFRTSKRLMRYCIAATIFVSCVKGLTQIVSVCNMGVSFSGRPRIEYQCQLFEQVPDLL
jgi:hypothetical protein